MNVKGAARPLHTRDQVTDVQDTLQCDMSPIVKEWRANPPAEIPLDPSEPKRFAKPALSEETMALGGASSASSVDVGSETPKDVSKVKQVIPDEVAVVEASPDNMSAEPPVACDKGDAPTGDEDLFHANADPVTRKQQFAERDALKKEMKKNTEPDPEEGAAPAKRPGKKAAQAIKKAEAKAKAKAKQDAKKAAEKAKKQAAKEKAKAKKEAKKAAEKAKKAKAKMAKAKTKTTKNGQKKRKELEEVDLNADVSAAVPENPPAPCPVPGEDVVMADASGSSACAAAVPACSAGSPASNAADDGLGDAVEDDRKTFARRFRPSRSDPASRFDAIKKIFKKHLAGRLNKESTMEARCCLFSPVCFSAAFHNSLIPPHCMKYLPFSLLRGGFLEPLHEASQGGFRPCEQL